MPKILKYQNPPFGLLQNQMTPSWQQTLNPVDKLYHDRKRYESMGINFGEAAKMAASKNSQSFSGALNQPSLNQGFLKSDIGKSIVQSAPQIGDAILGNVAKQADRQSGYDTALKEVSSLGVDLAVKTGNPILMAGALGLKGIDWLNRYAGKTVKDSGTGQLSTLGYQTEQENSGKFTLLGTGAANRTIKSNEQKRYSNILKYQTSRAANQDLIASKNKDVIGANYQQLMGYSKKGGTINPAQLRNLVKKVKKTSRVIPEIEVEKFENGGTIKNVIPEGALHARKHNIQGEIANSVTNKGIPVVTFEDGGEIKQHAEIEVNEIIFNKDLTQKIEDYFKKYNDADSQEEKNKIAIEAGKLLTWEILENTDDRTGLLNAIE